MISDVTNVCVVLVFTRCGKCLSMGLKMSLSCYENVTLVHTHDALIIPRTGNQHMMAVWH